MIDSVAGQLASKTFWNELDKHDLRGRVNRYAKTHGPFTADRLLSELEIDAQTAVELLGELRDAGELINGRFDERLDPGVAQWVHADVLKRIRSQSLAKARAAIKPVEPERYEAFLVHRQGVGSVGGERLQGLDGLLRAIEQLEGVALPMPVWERHVFPARVRDYMPTLLDELVGSGDVVWVGDPTGSGEGGDEAGRVMFFPADSPQLQVHAEALESSLGRAAAPESDMPLTVRDAILLALHDGGAYTAHSLEERAQSLWQANPEPEVNETTGEVMATSWSHSRFEQTLWSLVWHGFITNTALQPVRSMSTHTGGSKATVRSHRLRMRARTPTRGMFGGGLWSLVRAQVDASHEEAMIDLIGILLDRYGIIAPNTVSDAGVPLWIQCHLPSAQTHGGERHAIARCIRQGIRRRSIRRTRDGGPAASPYRFRACHDCHHGCMRSGESLWFVIGMAGAGHTRIQCQHGLQTARCRETNTTPGLIGGAASGARGAVCGTGVRSYRGVRVFAERAQIGGDGFGTDMFAIAWGQHHFP